MKIELNSYTRMLLEIQYTDKNTTYQQYFTSIDDAREFADLCELRGYTNLKLFVDFES